MPRSIIVAGALSLAGCAWGGGSDSHGVLPVDARIDGPRVDGPRVDAPMIDSSVDAMIDAPAPTGHLLITELVFTPVGAEYIEIVNPTTQAVALDQYYLADIGEYWQLPAAVPVINPADFLVRFPATASIAPGAVITIAIGTAAAYTTAHGTAPTYSVTDGTLLPITVGTGPTLTDAGEIVVLFQWNGGDLVKDVDIILGGVPSGLNGLVSKSSVMQGASTYAADADTIMPQLTVPIAGVSTKRILAETGNETMTGTVNGLIGHDETSENTRVTWDSTYTAPTPGVTATF